MKKIIALIMVLVLMTGLLAACGGNNGSDLAAIKKSGKIIVGITNYAPMDYKDDNGEWIGFDADCARLFAKELGVDVEFFVIADWGKKFYELETRNIDVIWNGMTISDSVLENTSCSNPYVYNAQVLVMNADVAADYADADSLKDISIAVEDGSAGQDVAADLGLENVIALQDQAAALLEVKAGTSDACIIDFTMANAMTGEGSNYSELTIAQILTEEEYGVGFRKDSDVTATFNTFMEKLAKDGTLTELAAKYELTLSDYMKGIIDGN